jgi:pyruvate carboxylase
MAGVLKPRAATILIDAIREKYPDLPIHVHTHDSAGTGVRWSHVPKPALMPLTLPLTACLA